MHTTTRRALLGAMAAAPVVAVLPAIAVTENSWDILIRRSLAAKAAHDAEWASYKRRKGRHTSAQEELLDRLCDEYCDLADHLMETPAPHAKAILWKAERILEDTDGGYTASWRADVVKPFLDDLRRLAREG